jgi:hypothetical protein
MIDPTYAAQVMAWAAAWSGLGLAARVYLVRPARRQPRRSDSAGKGGQ